MTLKDLKMPFGVPQNVCQFSVAIFKTNPISWLDIPLMKPLKKNSKMFYVLNLRKREAAERSLVLSDTVHPGLRQS